MWLLLTRWVLKAVKSLWCICYRILCANCFSYASITGYCQKHFYSFQLFSSFAFQQNPLGRRQDNPSSSDISSTFSPPSKQWCPVIFIAIAKAAAVNTGISDIFLLNSSFFCLKRYTEAQVGTTNGNHELLSTCSTKARCVHICSGQLQWETSDVDVSLRNSLSVVG